MAVGRPTKLTQEVIEQSKAYVESCLSELKIKEIPYVNKDGVIEYKSDVVFNVELPTIEGLAYNLGVNRDTVYEWCKGENDISLQFSDIIENLKAKQAKELINKGLSGHYNPTIAKVLLTKHGYREGVEHTGDEGGAINIKIEDKAKIDGALDKIL